MMQLYMSTRKEADGEKILMNEITIEVSVIGGQLKVMNKEM